MRLLLPLKERSGRIRFLRVRDREHGIILRVEEPISACATVAHSSRSSMIGSIDSARCAGFHVASGPSIDCVTYAVAWKTDGSELGDILGTRNRCLGMVRKLLTDARETS